MGRGEEERAAATAGCGREAHVSRHSYVFITTRLSCGWQCAQWEGGRGGGGKEGRRGGGGKEGRVGRRGGGEEGRRWAKENIVSCVCIAERNCVAGGSGWKVRP